MESKRKRKIEPPSDVRIGVYICHCGHNIASVIDVERVRDYAATLSGVVFARTNMFCCAEPGQLEIQEDIVREGINRVLVAACSPRLHETTFRNAVKGAGLNPYFLEMANIREHCSWVHGRERDKATEKACELVAMGVSKLCNAFPLEDRRVPVTRRAVVIGGGVAGLKASYELAGMGHPVTLVEKETHLGGKAVELWQNFDNGLPLRCLVDPLITGVRLNSKVKVLTGSTVSDLKGFIGNFELEIKNAGKRLVEKAGCVIVATGYDFFDPSGNPRYPFADLKGVVTTPELESLLKKNLSEISHSKSDNTSFTYQDEREIKKVAFLQCVGSRESGEGCNRYCSRVCCLVTIKQATILAETFGCEVVVFHKDIRVLQKWHEDMYRKAREAGVLFLRAQVENVQKDGEKLLITARNEIEGTGISVAVDMMVLSVGMVPARDSLALKDVLKIPLSDDGFFLESHPKLHPLETSMDGIFLAGACQGPKDFRESIVTGSGAAAKAQSILSKKELLLDGLVASVDPNACIGCGLCTRECPYGVIELVEIEGEQETSQTGKKKEKAKVITAACKGCGVCAGVCPTGAADTLGFHEESIMAQIEVALQKDAGNKILAFCCNWCSYAGADFAGVSRLEYPASLRIIRVMCSGRVNERFILRAFELGAGRVLVAGCHPPGDCHYISGNISFQKRFPKIKKKLEKKGFNPDHFRLAWISATEGPQFQSLIEELDRDLKGNK